ncbi:efflux RND transporter periplasmic adaptor subunit [Rhizobium sp.]|uniref:efflux RND transporter periplasmic adaptor subunit n=1 Tax=Rhizobium sp. TaxID=391 RepID=UPI002AA8B5F5
MTLLKTASRLGVCVGISIAVTAIAHSESNVSDKRYPAIVVIEANQARLTDRVVATGTIEAVEEVYVQPQVDSLAIKSLSADVGDKVVAGQVLATLDDSSLIVQKAQLVANQAKGEASVAQYKIQLNDAKTNEAEAQRQLVRGQTLVSSGSMSTSELQKLETSATNSHNSVASAAQAVAIAEADLKAVISQIDEVNLKLSRTAIKAPFGGLITARNAKIGAIASGSGTQLFTILRDDQLELVADVSEDDILKMRLGQTAKITIAGLKDPVDGKIRLISPVVNSTSRLGSVHIALTDSDVARQGMYANATISVAEGDGVVLPISAVETNKSGSVTRIVRDNIVHQISIETGIVDNGRVLITKGIKAGDLVVVKAGAFVRDGDTIRPVRDAAAPSN